MRPFDFWMLALWSAVMLVMATGVAGLVFSGLTYVAAACALWSSFKAFEREQVAAARPAEDVKR